MKKNEITISILISMLIVLVVTCIIQEMNNSHLEQEIELLEIENSYLRTQNTLFELQSEMDKLHIEYLEYKIMLAKELQK